MRTKKQALRRLKILYYVFFSIIIISVGMGIMSHDFRTGFREGQNDAQESFEPNDRHHSKIYSIPVRRDTYEMEIYTAADSSDVVRGRVESFDMQIDSSAVNGSIKPRSQGFAMIFSVIAMLFYLAVFVVIFMILISITKSVRNDNVFSRDNIVMTRLIGILLMAGAVCYDISRYIDLSAAQQILNQIGSNISIMSEFDLSFDEIITGVLILFLSEIFALGYDLSQEEKLTI